jgi:hypothetical protein
MKAEGLNHGDQKTRSIRRVRVRRDRRPSVVCACDARIRCRRRGDWQRRGATVWESHQVAATRPPLNIFQPNTRRAGSADIVNRRGSQCRARHNRMAMVKSARLVGALVSGLVDVLRARKYVGSPHRRVKLADQKFNGDFQLSVGRGGGKKSAILQFRPRHGVEGINTKQVRSKQ